MSVRHYFRCSVLGIGFTIVKFLGLVTVLHKVSGTGPLALNLGSFIYWVCGFL